MDRDKINKVLKFNNLLTKVPFKYNIFAKTFCKSKYKQNFSYEK